MVVKNTQELLAALDYKVNPYIRARNILSKPHLFAFHVVRMALERFAFNDQRIINIFMAINEDTSERSIFLHLTPIVEEYEDAIDLVLDKKRVVGEYNTALHKFYIARALRALFDSDIKKALPYVVRPMQSVTTILDRLIPHLTR